jgi:hypothetical protein
MDVPLRSTRSHALARAAVIAVMALIVAAPAALAAPPQHAPAEPPDLVLPGGDFCEHDIVLSSVSNGLRDTAFAPLPDGTERVIERGVAATSATDATTGAVLDTKGGSSLTFRFAADGSLVVVGTGWIFAWYLPGDDSDLGAGLFLVHGRITETYDSEGTFVNATFTGTSIDVCEALGD